MDSVAVSDLYKQYKAGTKRVVTWLVETASRQRTSSISSTPSSQEPLAYGTKALTDLAAAIARSQKPTQPPPANLEVIISVLRYVISGRKECASWFQRSPHTEDRSVASHQHFIDVLNTVLGHLMSVHDVCKTTATKKSAKQGPKRKGKGSRPASKSIPRSPNANGQQEQRLLQNIYLGLQDEVTTMDHQDTSTADIADAQRTQRTQGMPDVPERLELEASETDHDFAIWCFFKECDNIRNFIRGVWSSYAKGELSLSIASEITNAAFIFVRHAAKRFTNERSELATFECVLEHLHMASTMSKSCVGHGVTEHDSSISDTSSKEVGFCTILCLSGYEAVCKIHQLAECRLREFNAGAPHSEDDSESDHGHPIIDRVVNAFHTLWGVSQFASSCIETHGLHVFVEDAMTSFNAQCITLNTVVQTQIYMDIIDIIGKVSFVEYNSLRFITNVCDHVLRRFQMWIPRCSETDTFPPWFKDSYLRNHCLKSIFDATKVSYKELHIRMGGAPDEIEECLDDDTDLADAPIMASLHMTLPVLTGWYTASLLSLMHSDGIQISDCGLIIVSMAHLYNACRASGLLKARWEDMEFVIERQGATTLGIRNIARVDQPLQSAARLFGLALGVELKEYAKGGKANNIMRRTFLPPVSKIMQRRPRIDISSPFLTSLEACSRAAEDDIASERNVMEDSLYHLAKKLLKDSHSNLSPRLREQWEVCQKIEPEELLSLLKDSLQEDEMQFQFPYHRFFFTCAEYLEGMRKAVFDTVRDLRTSRGSQGDFHMYEMVDEILWEAAAAEQHSKTSLPYTMLGQIVRSLEVIIRVDGSLCVRGARQVMETQLRGCKDAKPSAEETDPGGTDKGYQRGRELFVELEEIQNSRVHGQTLCEALERLKLEERTDELYSYMRDSGHVEEIGPLDPLTGEILSCPAIRRT